MENISNQTGEKCSLCKRPNCVCGRDLGLLALRIGLGAVFLYHGIGKLQNMEGTIKFFASVGFGPFLTYLVALAETLGGLSILLGAFTKWAGFALAAIMIVAIVKVKILTFHLPFSGPKGGWELDFILLAAALAAALAGPGRISLKCSNCGKCCGAKCDVGGQAPAQK